MSKFNIALIKPNKLEYNNLSIVLGKDELKDLNQDNILIVEVPSNDELVQYISELVDFDEKVVCDCNIIYESNEFIYQMFFLNNGSLKVYGKNETKLINEVASHFNGLSDSIYNNAVIVKYGLNDNMTAKNASVSMDDLNDILYRKLFKRAIMIEPDSSQNEIITYKSSVFEYFELKNLDKEYIDNNLCILEVAVYGFYFNIIYEKYPESDKINKSVTKLLGRGKLNGKCIIALKVTDNEFIDLNPSDYEKIITICSNTLIIRNLDDEEKPVVKHEDYDEKINGLPVIKNRFISLNNRFNKYEDKCHNCNELFKNESNLKALICSGCYRMKYCSHKCQNNNWLYHKKECLHNIKAINDSSNEVSNEELKEDSNKDFIEDSNKDFKEVSN